MIDTESLCYAIVCCVIALLLLIATARGLTAVSYPTVGPTVILLRTVLAPVITACSAS
jgi:hypothetical protein